MGKRTADRLSHLLRTERQALLAGDLDMVGSLIEEKTALTESLAGSNSKELRALAEALEQNGRLIAAAQEGVAAVLTTLKQQRAARSSLSSYDPSGNAKQISPVSGGTERRF